MARATFPPFIPRVELWPAQPPDLPNLEPEDVEESGELDRFHSAGPLGPAIPVPEDFALRECLQVDPTDPGQLLAFMRHYGRLEPRLRDPLGALPGRASAYAGIGLTALKVGNCETCWDEALTFPRGACGKRADDGAYAITWIMYCDPRNPRSPIHTCNQICANNGYHPGPHQCPCGAEWGMR